ncbi:Uncharacterized protein TCM_024942 [Theobroma cacao]|uniref:WRC domain-containing protein n=1 Tax=Theobroma cacao TaxID=3641 RepID=A0A061EXJ9_THECC|nr:Uncharacterized protein TCM_024942 [Theobroma cacao]
MRIRNSGPRSISPPPDHLSSILRLPPSAPREKPAFSPTKAMMTASDPLSSSLSDQQAPHVMVSRINARLSSFDNGADSKDAIFSASSYAQDSWSFSSNESFGHGIFGQTQTSTSSSASSSLSYSGRWCEEERAIPLKKRRVVMISYETKQSKEIQIMKKDALGRKREMGEMEGFERCNRGNGKGWRCNKMRVKGHRLCKHHLEMQRMRSMNCPSRNQGDSFAGGANQMRENKRVRVVKARSMSSLLRDSVPLLY